MARIGIICAMGKEFALLSHEAFKSANVRCELSGIGKANAAMAAQKLIDEFHPDCILSIGCAGSYNGKIHEGDLIIASQSAYHDAWSGNSYEPGQIAGMPRYFNSDPGLLKAAALCYPDARTGLLITGDQFYLSEEEDARQKSLYPDALAVDMEGAAVAQVAFKRNIPFLALKVISDTHLDGRQRERYDDFWRTLAPAAFKEIHRIIEAL